MPTTEDSFAAHAHVMCHGSCTTVVQRPLQLVDHPTGTGKHCQTLAGASQEGTAPIGAIVWIH